VRIGTYYADKIFGVVDTAILEHVVSSVLHDCQMRMGDSYGSSKSHRLPMQVVILQLTRGAPLIELMAIL
jgi:hypothetical protein